MLNIGIIGAGKIVQSAYLPGFSPKNSELSQTEIPWYAFGGCENARMVSLCGKNIDEAREFAARFNIPTVTENWQDVVNDEKIDAVCIATPNYLHSEISIAAANAGKHVLVEKPISVTLEQADAMIDAAENNNVFLMVEQTFRFLPIVELARQMIQSGMLGKILSVKSKFGTPGPDMWAPGSDWFFSPNHAGYGTFLDVGIHAVDLTRYIINQKVNQVFAFGSTLIKDINMDDNSISIWKFADGALGVIEASWTSIFEISVIVNAEKGLMKMQFGDQRPLSLQPATGSFTEKISTQDGTTEFMGIKGTFENGIFYPDIPDKFPYDGPFQYFIDCILNKTKPMVSGEEGRLALQLVLAGYESMKNQSIISFD